MEKRELRFRNRLAYGAGDLYGGGAFMVIGVYFLLFLTTVVGLNPALAGLIISLGKVWDAVTDPAMGLISDRTRSRFGRRRVYFLIGIFPIGLSFFLLWVTVNPASQLLSFFYYLFAYMFFNTVFTMVMVPYNTLPAEMVSGYADRSRMVGVRMIFSQLGTLFCAVVPGVIFGMKGRTSEGYLSFALVIGIFFMLPWIFTYLGTWERQEEPGAEEESGELKNIFREFFSTFRNRSFRSHVGMYLSAYAAMDIFMASLIYYLIYYLRYQGGEQLIMGVVLCVQIIGVFTASRESMRFGNARTYRIHLVIWMIGLTGLALLPPGVPVWAVLVFGAVFGFGMAGGVFVPYNNLAFVIDADTILTGKRREGIYSGMATFTRKIAQAASLQLVGIGLSLAGFVKGAEVQSPATVTGIRILFISLPLALMVLGLVFSRFFRITPETHKTMMIEMENRRAGRDGSDDPEVVRVCELVTGHPYAELGRQR
jgi:oligogalacturonide transporter